MPLSEFSGQNGWLQNYLNALRQFAARNQFDPLTNPTAANAVQAAAPNGGQTLLPTMVDNRAAGPAAPFNGSMDPAYRNALLGLAARNRATLNALAARNNSAQNNPLINILAPYTTGSPLQGAAAKNYLDQHPLNITQTQADALDKAVHGDIIRDVATRFDRDTKGANFYELPEEAQTAIADLALQYGPDLARRAPNLWNQVTNGNWLAAADELNDFHDAYGSRRQEEKKRLYRGFNDGNLPLPDF